MSLLLTIGILLVLICLYAWSTWMLFARKMSELHFPGRGGGEGSHTYWMSKLRIWSMVHTILLCIFALSFCLWIW